MNLQHNTRKTTNPAFEERKAYFFFVILPCIVQRALKKIMPSKFYRYIYFCPLILPLKCCPFTILPLHLFLPFDPAGCAIFVTVYYWILFNFNFNFEGSRACTNGTARCYTLCTVLVQSAF